MMKIENKICPLLSDDYTYSPDTIDLLNDEEAINYWLPCLEEMVKTFVNKVEYLKPQDATARERAQQCYLEFHELVRDVTLNSRWVVASTLKNSVICILLVEFLNR